MRRVADVLVTVRVITSLVSPVIVAVLATAAAPHTAARLVAVWLLGLWVPYQAVEIGGLYRVIGKDGATIEDLRRQLRERVRSDGADEATYDDGWAQ
jgi:hypothetical protein